MAAIGQLGETFSDWKVSLASWRKDTRGNVFNQQFESALQDLENDSSVGLCEMRKYGTLVSDALKWDGISYDRDRVEILKALSFERLVRPQDSDNIRVFIKREPHKQSKLDSGRLRLISAVSLVDAMVDRSMFTWLSRRVLETVGTSPVMVGWSPMLGGWRYMNQKFAGAKTCALDKTAWDWTVPGWMLLDMMHFLRQLAVMAPEWWHEWLERRWKALFRNATFEFGNGVKAKQPCWGIMKSGCYLTLLLNSVMQVYLHLLIVRRLKIERPLRYVVMGDDETIEDFQEYREYVEEFRRMGFHIKAASPTEHVEFCGTLFFRDRAIPAYWRKHVFAITHYSEETLVSALESMQLLYAHEPVMLEWIQLELSERAPSKVMSTGLLRRLYDGQG